jgi:predicted choloylglycine hydrolase
MDDRPIIRNVVYTHSVLEGTTYEVGKLQGERMLLNPEAARFFTSPFPGRNPLTPQQAETTLKFFQKHCPGLDEEIHGFADALGVPPEQVVYYAFTYQSGGQCSHFAVLPSISADGHLRVGRSYEYNYDEDDMRLVTTRIQGQAAHIGFSEVLFGRADGINEHGLCATMSAGAPTAPTEPGGCMFWAVVRTVLDRCATVDEAIEVVQSIPISFNFNLILADRSGQAALVEIACSHRAVKRIQANSPEQKVIATNHYTLPEMKPYDLGRMWNSLLRYRAIRNRLEAMGNQVSSEGIRAILSDRIPQGVCCHHYTDYLGTLWSAVIDVTTGTLDICFGAPTHNPWHTFDLNSPVGVTEYAVQLPDEQADPAFFRKLAPGRDK